MDTVIGFVRLGLDGVHAGKLGYAIRPEWDATSYLSAQDLTPIGLWVHTANHRARRFYEARGFRCDNETSRYRREQDGHIAEATAVRYTLSTPG